MVRNAPAPKNARTAKQSQLRFKEYIYAALLSIALVWLLFLNFNIFRKEQIAQKAAHDTKMQLVALQTRQNTLQRNINELSTERGQESTMRETFGVAKPGEGVIIVVPTVVATTTPPKTFWQKWFGWAKFW